MLVNAGDFSTINDAIGNLLDGEFGKPNLSLCHGLLLNKLYDSSIREITEILSDRENYLVVMPP